MRHPVFFLREKGDFDPPRGRAGGAARVNPQRSKPTTDDRKWTATMASNSLRTEMPRADISTPWAQEEATRLRRKAQQDSRQHQAAGGRGPSGQTNRLRTREAAPRNGRTTVRSPSPAAQWQLHRLRRHKRNSSCCSTNIGSSNSKRRRCNRCLSSRRERTRT